MPQSPLETHDVSREQHVPQSPLETHKKSRVHNIRRNLKWKPTRVRVSTTIPQFPMETLRGVSQQSRALLFLLLQTLGSIGDERFHGALVYVAPSSGPLHVAEKLGMAWGRY